MPLLIGIAGTSPAMTNRPPRVLPLLPVDACEILDLAGLLLPVKQPIVIAARGCNLLGMWKSGHSYGLTALVYSFVAVASALTEWLSFFIVACVIAPSSAALAAFFVGTAFNPKSAAERSIDPQFTGGTPEY
jgi:hypothetical protein